MITPSSSIGWRRGLGRGGTRFVQNPLSSVLSPLLRRGERKKKRARQKSSLPATISTDTDAEDAKKNLTLSCAVLPGRTVPPAARANPRFFFLPSLRSLHCNRRNCSQAAMKFSWTLLSRISRIPRLLLPLRLRLCRAVFFAVHSLRRLRAVQP